MCARESLVIKRDITIRKKRQQKKNHNTVRDDNRDGEEIFCVLLGFVLRSGDE